jgi:hypothetical protein
MKRTITLLAIVFASLVNGMQLIAQTINNSVNTNLQNLNYDQLKAAGLLGNYSQEQINQLLNIHAGNSNSVTKHAVLNTSIPSLHSTNQPQTVTNCNCWIDLDSTFNIAPTCQGTCNPPEYRNDDGFTDVIPIAFNFCLYGENQNSLFINNNGNVSFGSSYGTYTSQPFPTASFSMVAPFWADVDTRNLSSGLVYYKLTPTYLIVQWDSVGYYSSQADKQNTFQLIISDGIDPIIPGGNNVSFCYKDMQWTTGSASGGTNGFGGTPSTVGINKGDGVDYIQIGRYDHAGVDYDGPFGNADGVSWLDNQSFSFNVCTSTNIQPIVSGLGFCDTITVCAGDSVFPSVSFLSPEAGQFTSATATSTLQNFSIADSLSGNSASITAGAVTTNADAGYQTITFTATDNGTPVLSTNVTVTIHVLAAPNANAGPDATYCSGVPVQINATGGVAYSWSPSAGLSDPNISNPLASPSSPTAYVVTVTGSNSCSARDTVIISIGAVNLSFQPANPAICEGASTTLTASGADHYSWSPITGISNPNNADSSSVDVTGNTTTIYTVTGTTLSGCSGTQTVTLTVNQAPLADLSPNGNLTICGSNGITLNSIAGDYHYTWYLDGNIVQSGSDPSYFATTPGVYQVSVGDNQSGCSNLSQTATIVIGGGPVVSVIAASGCGNVLYNGGSATLSASASGAVSYQWSQNGNPIPGATSATLTVTQPGTYCVTAYDANGCASEVPACNTVNSANVICGQHDQKVILCHVPPGNPGNPQTLCIAPSAVPAHLANHPGDCLGSCDLYYPRLSNGSAPLEILEFLAEAYPNPFSNGFTIHVISSEESAVLVNIHDVTGRIVETYKNVDEHMVLGSNLAPGLYSAEVIQGENRQMVNILKADR